MAVKKLWTINHACGHTTVADLSDRPTDRRAGNARWLAERDCAAYWRANQGEDTESKAEWLAKKRAAEQTEAEEWSMQYRMPPLDGTDRAIAWGTRCRPPARLRRLHHPRPPRHDQRGGVGGHRGRRTAPDACRVVAGPA
nr:hypothetical protein [Streptomyces sp. NBC_01356]